VPAAEPVVRPENPADHDAIREVVATAFGSEVEALLVDRIRVSSEYVADMALVAELNGEIAGYVTISGATIRNAAGERAVRLLSPLAVAPDYQRIGIGSALVRSVLAAADARGEPLVVVEGSPDYYGRLGFEPAARYGITIPLPEWAPPEAAQMIRLRSFDPDEPSLRGTVVYPPAFDGIG
jgi:putative acetyltransferase